MNNIFLQFADWLWGIPMLVILIGGGLYLSFRIGFAQVVKLPFVLKHTIGKSFNQKGEDGSVSGYQAVTAALSSTLGTGNITGVALAIAYGGPGAIFWLWVTGFVAMAIKYCEIVCAMNYREKNSNGEWVGGPMIYLSKGTGIKGISAVYAILAAITLFLASSAQVGAITETLEAVHIPRIPATVVIVILVALIVIGGFSRLISVSEKVVPVMSIIYMIGGFAVILFNAKNIPGMFAEIFRGVFTPTAAVGGFGGATVIMALRWGLSRGVYSSDSGDGLTSIAHSKAEANHPVQQAIWGIFEVFFDTIVICTITALVIMSSGVWKVVPTELGSTLTLAAFQQTLGNAAGGTIVAVTLTLFAFTTAVAQVFFGIQQLVSVLGEKSGKIITYIFPLFLLAGGIVGISALISYVDLADGLIILINIFGLLKMSTMISQKTKEYFANPEKYETK